MKGLRKIIPNNIITLRKQMGLTQMGLAKKINYSDKAVSRWEKGEVLPDIETLESLANVFNVPLSYLLKAHNENDIKEDVVPKNEVAFQLLLVLALWTVCTIIIALGELYFNVFYWQCLVWTVPASLLMLSILNRRRKNSISFFIINTLLCWSFLAAVYFQFLNLNFWLVFIIGIPVQAAILVWYLTQKNKKR